MAQFFGYAADQLWVRGAERVFTKGSKKNPSPSYPRWHEILEHKRLPARKSIGAEEILTTILNH